ncbi:Double homeobox protein 4C [Lemmus lemmus]
MQETRRRTVWQARQKETLIAAFSRNPYPTFREREELAREIGLPESRVRVWFQNHRSRTGVVRSLQRLQEPLAKTEARSTLKGRTRPRTQISWAQLTILHQAFERDPFPKLPAREDLARRTGLPEDTIYIWFQNRRARHHVGGMGRVRGQHSQASSSLKGRVCGSETELTQDSLFALAAAGGWGIQSVTQTTPPTSSMVSLPAEAQPSEPDHPELHEDVCNMCLEELIHRVLTEITDNKQAWATLDPDEKVEERDETPENLLDEEEYQKLLDMLKNS